MWGGFQAPWWMYGTNGKVYTSHITVRLEQNGRDHFSYAPSQWETTLHCNVVSHWLGAYTKWTLEWLTFADNISNERFGFCLKFHWSLLLSVQLTNSGVGDKPLPEPVMALFYDIIWHNKGKDVSFLCLIDLKNAAHFIVVVTVVWLIFP